jgi:SAM-dependent MidA family methyltransferase
MISLDPQSQEHSLAFKKHLQQTIQEQGPMSFETFVDQCLYHPKWGYYMQETCPIGKDGDFITAYSKIGVFAKAIASFIAILHKQLKSPMQILEVGPGKGQLADALLTHCDAKHISHYCLQELNPHWQKQQKTFLQQSLNQKAFAKLHWQAEKLDPDVFTLVIANEIVDALSFHRVIKQNHRWQMLTLNSALNWQNEPIDLPELKTLCASLPDLPEGYCTELRLRSEPWLADIQKLFTQGMMLVFDYGYLAGEYFHPQRDQGSLQCFYKHHQIDDVLWAASRQDITAHVNFTHFFEQASKQNLSVEAYTNQSHFLLSCLLETNHKKLSIEERQTLKMLILPSQMGDLIKVCLLKKNSDIDLGQFDKI